MSDTDGSSSAARRAQDETDAADKPGLMDWLFGKPAPSDEAAPGAGNGSIGTNGHDFTAHSAIGSLGHLRLEDVAVPRAEIVSVPVDISLTDLVDIFRDSGLSRLPVFRDTLDTPLGLVHLKDLALKHGFACDESVLDLATTLRPLIFAPPSMPIGVLLQKMQSERKHMALIIDEYGGVDGLVTIEDLIEQIVGEIEDEHDIEEAAYWQKAEDGSYTALAKAPLDEFEAETGVSLALEADDDEFDTLGGLVFMLAGHVPVRGEVVKHPGGAEFEVLDADPRRIKRLKVALPDQASD